MPEISKLSIYSIAVVAKNKALSSKEIECVPLEDTPMISGEITDNASQYKSKAADASGAAYQTDITTTSTVKATWLPIGSSNRLTAPDVRRGESVALYRFADSDQFFWTTLRDDMRLRKLETVIYGFSATTDESAKPTAENMYFLEISTHQKLVHFHTSKANGEPFTYDIQINTKEGFIQIQDDSGNFFSFNSKERQIEMVNSDGSKVDINKKEIFLEATDLISLKAKTVKTEATNIEDKATSINSTADDVLITGTGSAVFTGGAVSVG